MRPRIAQGTARAQASRASSRLWAVWAVAALAVPLEAFPARPRA